MQIKGNSEVRNEKCIHLILRARNKTTKIKLVKSNTKTSTFYMKNLINHRNEMRKSWQFHRNNEDRELMRELNMWIREENRIHRNDSWNIKLKLWKSSCNSIWEMSEILKKPYKKSPTFVRTTHYMILINTKQKSYPNCTKKPSTLRLYTCTLSMNKWDQKFLSI